MFYYLCLRAVCKIIIGNGIAIEEIWTNVISVLAEGATAIIMEIHSHYVFILINNVPVKSTRSLSTLNCLSKLVDNYIPQRPSAHKLQLY